MKTHIRGTLFLLALMPLLALTACGQRTTGPNEVSMVAADFSMTSITVKAGQAVHFTDPAGTGGTHTICLGTDGACDKGAQGPQALQSPGFTINAGDPAKDVTFDTPGTYKITCSIHPSMNLTVTVQ
ncbi:MAG TPA: plastocyanin/azurin family copper-binding protein [Ktedonobacterales bacterium]